MFMRESIRLLACLALVVPTTALADGALEEDRDVDLLDMHLALHTGADAAAAALATGSIIAGLEDFTEGTPNAAISGLTLTLWGAATIIGAVTSIDGNLRNWERVRPTLAVASAAERRLFRETQTARLRQVAINRAIALAADGVSLGIGIALRVGAPLSVTQSLGESLVVNGVFLLGIDIFRTAVDGEVAGEWETRNEVAEEGYFGSLDRPRLPPVSLAIAPIARVLPDGSMSRGGFILISGRF
jgi:hypothetical protein